jgi:signal transduction histidine kinase/ligand-binding sensor domain-containing protein/DNA-binding response OmpR family regulator
MLYLFKHSFLLFVLAFLGNTVCIVPQTIHFNHLTTEDGLSNNNVYDVIQDQIGFLWFATDDGLNRFDGYDFKVFRNDPTNKNSLSDNSVWALREDKNGNIWIGTQNGWLNRYDQVTENFRRWKIESDVLKENAITYIYEDREGLIWVGTYRSGLYRPDPSNNKIDHWYNKPNDNSSISNNYVSSILEDKNGNLWISTYNGLNKFNPKSPSKIFTHYFHLPENSNSISNSLVWFLTQSESDPNIIWIGTANGLTKFQIDKEIFSQIQIPNPDRLQFGNAVASVIEEKTKDGENVLWIDSYAGLIRLNIKNGNANRLINDKYDPNSIISNQIHRMFRDRSNVVWLATDKGLSYFSFKNAKFNYLFSDNFNITNPEVIRKKNITAITITSDKRIWFGTDEGLYYSDNSNGTMTIKKLKHLEKLNVWSLASGSNELWIGTYGSGLFQLDLKTDRLKAIPNYEKKSKSPAVKYVKSLCVDKEDNLWIGFWGMGLARLNPSNEHYEGWLNNKGDTSSLSFDDVWVIHQDRKGRMWIGTDGGGLNLAYWQAGLLDENDGGRFYRWNVAGSGSENLSSRGVYSICEASMKKSSEDVTVLWIGTNNGLNKFVVKNSESNKEFSSPPEVEITQFTIKNGLADNSIKSIVEDDNGNLWLGTGSGISFFDIDKNQFTNFSKTDGVVGSDFNFSAAYKNKDGIIFMGNTEGLNYFFPSDIKLSTFMPPLLITDFQIFNKSVEINEDSPLKSSIFQNEKIILSYRQNVFSFQFAALDYSSPQKIQYEYKMEGFDKDWVNSGSRRFVTYTNLNPGEYNFKVKSTNSDGIWNENIRELKVIITPPWWQTPWAIGLYALIFMLGVWGIFKFQTYRTRLQQELKMQEFEAHHLREIESMKSRFFANLSHEFRTPLTLIKGPLEQLISGRIKENLKDYYKMLLRNTEKLQNLIDQLLELSQLEAETIPLNKQRLDLVSLLRSFTYNFMPLADEKFITLVFNSSVESLTAMVDRDKIEKIINNLLSNAFKFTPAGGKITVDIALKNSTEPGIATIKISDTGIGILEEHQSKIFDRFFQIDDNSANSFQQEKRSSTGSGIGLALVKELVSLHNWNISVKSKEGEGTTFTLKIPVDKEAAFEDLKEVPSITEPKERRREEISNLIELEDEIEMDTEKQQEERPIVLIVEDSPDVRSYVYDLLKQDYKVLLAENAEVGIELALKNTPDLILSDIMMPGMDGIEFCHRIKTDWQTSHIPFILLTAKATEESKIEGLETGADDYLTKPFNYEELAVRIKNLIEQRKRLREKFGKEINVKAETLSSNVVDKEFVQKIIDIIEKNLGNENFSSETLAEQLFVSRSQLNRKLQAVIGQGPGEFIRSYKLKRAAQMILENRLNITQIAYEVGFGSPAQFTRSFKKYFNCLPSEFINNLPNN